MGWHMHEMGSVAWIYLVILALVIVIAVIFVVRMTLNTSEQEKTPLEILKNRYARGEITREEFEKIKKDIMQVRS